MKLSVMRSLCVLALASISTTVRADETGVAGIHTWQKVGKKTCLVDHYHYGSGSGRTRKEAERAAIGSWAGFTAWEYGSSWGRYAIAVGKSMNCSNDAAEWSCSTHARACRPW